MRIPCIFACLTVVSAASAAHIDSATSTLAGTPGVSLINFEGKSEGQLIGGGVYTGVTFSQPDGGRPMIDNSPFLFGYTASSGTGVLTGSQQGGAPYPTVAGLIATFATGQSAVEAFFSDTAPLGSYKVYAYGLGGSLLDSFTISAEQRYVGFTNSAGGIYSVQFGPSSASGDAFAIDDLRSIAGTGAVPEPASWAMFIVGFGVVGHSLRRRSAKVSFA